MTVKRSKCSTTKHLCNPGNPSAEAMTYTDKVFATENGGAARSINDFKNDNNIQVLKRKSLEIISTQKEINTLKSK